jgi:hypothetical protein
MANVEGLYEQLWKRGKVQIAFLKSQAMLDSGKDH